METSEEVMKNKGKIRMNELRIKAIIKLLEKEGIIIEKEIDDKVSELLKEDEE